MGYLRYSLQPISTREKAGPLRMGIHQQTLFCTAFFSSGDHDFIVQAILFIVFFYRIGFANKTVSGCVSTLCNPP